MGSEDGDFRSLAGTPGRHKGSLDGKDFVLREKLPFADKVCQPEKMSNHHFLVSIGKNFEFFFHIECYK